MNRRMRIRRLVAFVGLIAALGMLSAMVAGAQAQQDSVAGGGSLNGQLVELPQGGSLGSVYSVYYRNDTAETLPVEFFSDAPPGITVVPDVERVEIAPTKTERIFYRVQVGIETAPGDYEVKTGLRPLVESKSGVEITTAFATSFPLRVTGAGSELTVRARDVSRGAPAVGQVSIARLGSGNASMVLAKVDGSELTSRVSPGDYEVRFDLGGKTLAKRSVTVVADQPQTVDLDVQTVTFDDVRLVRNDVNGSLQTVDVFGIIDNDLGVIPRVETRLLVTHNGEALDAVALKSFAPLPEGLQEVSGRYVPAKGWVEGEYAFTLELFGDDLAVRSQQPVTLVIGGVAAASGSDSALPDGVELWMLAAGGAVLVLLVLLLVIRSRRRRGVTAAASTPSSAARAKKSTRDESERRTKKKKAPSRRAVRRATRRASDVPPDDEPAETVTPAAVPADTPAATTATTVEPPARVSVPNDPPLPVPAEAPALETPMPSPLTDAGPVPAATPSRATPSPAVPVSAPSRPSTTRPRWAAAVEVSEPPAAPTPPEPVRRAERRAKASPPDRRPRWAQEDGPPAQPRV